MAGAPGGDYLSRAIVHCGGAPTADTADMRKLGDKIGSKLIAEEVGVPVAAWSGGGVATLADALEAADRIGYPLMLKATAGGGGRGIRMAAVVTTPTALYPEGVTRVVLCGDPTAALGAVSEPECSRIIAAIDLAERMKVPVEWFAISAGAYVMK